MAPPTIAIVFDQEAGMFFPGQTITGRLEVVNTKERKCEGISVKFKCAARVQFYQNVTVQGKSQRQSRGAVQIIYKNKNFVWADPSQILTVGEFQFPFTFLIPLSSPSSFQCQSGFLLHGCQVKIQLIKASNVSGLRLYNVISLLDLNMNHAHKVAQVQRNMKSLCCLCCRSGPISASIRVDRSGYVPGEAIVVSGEVNNSSNRKINYTKAELYMTVTLTAGGGCMYENYKLFELLKPEIPKGGDCIWEGDHIIIPPVPASGLEGCNIMNIVYNVLFTVQPKLPATPLTLTFPITIGTIPLRETFNRFSRSPGQLLQEGHYPPDTGATGSGFCPPTAAPYPPDAPPAYSAPMFPAMNQYPDLPPPSYYTATADELSVAPQGMPSKEGDGNGTATQADAMKGFSPRYVYYDLKNHA